MLTTPPPTPHLPDFRPTLRLNFIFQICLIAFGSIILDGGHLFRLFLYAAVAYWATIIYLAFRRPHTLTPNDQSIVRLGFAIYLLLGIFINSAAYSIALSIGK